MERKSSEWFTVRETGIIMLGKKFGVSKKRNGGIIFDFGNKHIAEKLDCADTLLSKFLQTPPTSDKADADLPGGDGLINMLMRILLYEPTKEIKEMLQKKWEANHAAFLDEKALLQKELATQLTHTEQQQQQMEQKVAVQQGKQKTWQRIALGASIATLLVCGLFYGYYQSERSKWKAQLDKLQAHNIVLERQNEKLKSHTITLKQQSTELRMSNFTLKETTTELQTNNDVLERENINLQNQIATLHQQTKNLKYQKRQAETYVLLKNEADVHKAVYMFSKANISGITLAAYQIHDRIREMNLSGGELSDENKIALMREVVDRLSNIISSNRKEMQTVTTRYITRQGKSLHKYIDATVAPLFNLDASVLAFSPLDSLPPNATLFDHGVVKGRPYFLSPDTPKAVLAQTIAEQVETLQDKQVELVLDMIEKDGGF